MRLKDFLKQAQPGMPMDPMMTDPSMIGQPAPMPPPDMGTQGPPPGQPQPPTPEELMMMMGQQGAAMPPADLMAPAEGQEQIIEKQIDVIDGLAQTVQKLVDLNISSGNEPEATADNVAASIVGSGLLDNLPIEELPLAEEAPAI